MNDIKNLKSLDNNCTISSFLPSHLQLVIPRTVNQESIEIINNAMIGYQVRIFFLFIILFYFFLFIFFYLSLFQILFNSSFF